MNKLKNMKYSLSENLRISLVKCYIISQLDYCNFLYANITKKQLNNLQKCLNAAMRFVYSIRRSKSITPYLKKAHILPVKYRIVYKLCLLVFKCLFKLVPEYLCTLLKKRETNRLLRSAADTTFMETEYPEGTIAYSMCKEWNKLPQIIRESTTIDAFKKSLKTHLFCIAFEE